MKSFWYFMVVVLMLSILGSFSNLTATNAVVVNLPPKWDLPSVEFESSGEFVLDLNSAFFDIDGDSLSFSVSPGSGVSAGIVGSELHVLGEGSVVVTVSDGKNLVSQKLFVR